MFKDFGFFASWRETMVRNGLDKLISLFCVLVFVTFLVNHGHINFCAVDWVREKTVEAVQSEEGQEYIEETKEISKGILSDILHAIDRLVNGKEEESENSSAG